MKVSIVSATYKRAELLDNALQTYSKQTMSFDEWEYLVCDDNAGDPDDNTKKVVENWQKKGLNIRYFTADDLGRPKKQGEWRDGCALRNSLSTWAFGRVIIATHPEIMIPPNALEIMYETSMKNPESWITAVPYWMPYGKIPKGWKDDIAEIKKMEGFYDPSWPDPLTAPGAVDYRNQNQEVRPTWESEVFWAMQMSKWRWMGGFREFTVWGSVDMDFLSRRAKLMIRTVIAKDNGRNLMVYHQNHESKRDMDAAHQALKGSHYNPQSAREMGGLYSVYNHGHRERSMDGELKGILGDHISRYEFARGFTANKVVLDVPCGTGYGSHVLYRAGVKPRAYLGIDIDQESVDYAKQTYQRNASIEFLQGDMKKIDADTDLFDIAVCFEGLEHISPEDRELFVKELKRVLKPGGTVIVSTPQKGAANGTPWDKYVMTKSELKKLFGDWINVDWFYQKNYGSRSTPIPTSYSKLPSDAEIMILGATNTTELVIEVTEINTTIEFADRDKSTSSDIVEIKEVEDEDEDRKDK